MVYEKFSRKNGKTYGPYLYHNKRVDGKVVTAYHGKKEDRMKTLFLISFFAIMIILFSFYYFRNEIMYSPLIVDLRESSPGSFIQGTANVHAPTGQSIPLNSIVELKVNAPGFESITKRLPLFDLIDLRNADYALDTRQISVRRIEALEDATEEAEFEIIYPEVLVDVFLMEISDIIVDEKPETEIPSEETPSEEEPDEPINRPDDGRRECIVNPDCALGKICVSGMCVARETNTCFLAGTLILTEDGEIPIEKISVGDYVLSFNEKIQKEEYSLVSEKFVHETRGYFIINEKIKVTGEHPFYTARGLVEVEDLKAGDFMKSSEGFEEVEKIEFADGKVEVYNLEVAGNHNYFAEGVLVHNKISNGERDESSSSIDSSEGVLDSADGVGSIGGGKGGSSGGGKYSYYYAEPDSDAKASMSKPSGEISITGFTIKEIEGKNGKILTVSLDSLSPEVVENIDYKKYRAEVVPGSGRLAADSNVRIQDDYFSILSDKTKGTLIVSTNYEEKSSYSSVRSVELDLEKAKIIAPSVEDASLEISILNPTTEEVLTATENSIPVKDLQEGYQIPIDVNGERYGALADGPPVKGTILIDVEERILEDNLLTEDFVREYSRIPESASITGAQIIGDDSSRGSLEIQGGVFVVEIPDETPGENNDNSDGNSAETPVVGVPEVPVDENTPTLEPEQKPAIGSAENADGDFVTGNAIEENTELNILQIKLNYELPAPTSSVIFDEDEKKYIVNLFSDFDYERVLFYVNIEETPVESLSRVRVVDEERHFASIEGVGLDSDGKISELYVLADHLSNRTYEVLIETSNAEHLNQDRIFVSNIFDSVIEIDGNWSEEISDREFVRVYFQSALNSSQDISFYARSNGTSAIQLYSSSGVELIGEIPYVGEEGSYKIYLSGLENNESYDSFDLRILGDTMQFDWIANANETFFSSDSYPSVIFSEETPVNNSFVSPTGFSVGLLTNESFGRRFSFVDMNHDLILWLAGENSFGDSSSRGINFVSDSVEQISGGSFGNSYLFDGESSAQSANGALNFDRSKEFSISFWLDSYQNSPSQFTEIFGAGRTNNKGIDLGIDRNSGSEKIKIILKNGSSSDEFVGSEIIPDENYHHYVYVFENSVAKWYFDGEWISSEYSSIDFPVMNEGSLIFGTSSQENYFNGSLDEFMIFNRSLTAQEISSLYDSSSSDYQREFLLQRGDYSFRGFVVDEFGKMNSTSERFVKVANPLSSCESVLQNGQAYFLLGNLSSAASCLVLTSSDIVIDGQGNTISGGGNHTGIYVGNSDGVEIRNLKLKDFDVGVGVISSDNFEIENLEIDSSRTGIYLEDSSHGKISDLTSSQNLNGLYLSDSSYNEIFSGEFSLNDGNGVILFNSANNDFRENEISENYYGLTLNEGSNRNLILNNKFSGNEEFEILDLSNSDGNFLLYNNSHGEYRWIDNSSEGFLKDLTFSGEIDPETFIRYNQILPSELYSGLIDSAAQVTLRNIPEGTREPVIIDGVLICDETTTPNCVNETILSGEVVFRVSGLGQYKIGDSGGPTVTLVNPANEEVVLDGNQTFSWDGFDFDGESDIESYQLNIELVSPEGNCEDFVPVIYTADESHTLETPLKCFFEDGNYYIWSVRARDSEGFGSWSFPNILKISDSLLRVDLELGLAAEDSQEVDFLLRTLNLGEQDVLANSRIDIYDIDGILVESIPLGIDTIQPRDFVETNARVDLSEEGSGNYKAVAILEYADFVAIDEIFFSLGSSFVDISDYMRTINNERVNKFYLEVKSLWNNQIEDVYYDVEIIGTNISVQSEKARLGSFETKRIYANIDARNLNSGNEKIKIDLHYLNQTTSRTFDVRIGKKYDSLVISLISVVVIGIAFVIWSLVKIHNSKKSLKKRQRL